MKWCKGFKESRKFSSFAAEDRQKIVGKSAFPCQGEEVWKRRRPYLNKKSKAAEQRPIIV